MQACRKVRKSSFYRSYVWVADILMDKSTHFQNICILLDLLRSQQRLLLRYLLISHPNAEIECFRRELLLFCLHYIKKQHHICSHEAAFRLWISALPAKLPPTSSNTYQLLNRCRHCNTQPSTDPLQSAWNIAGDRRTSCVIS